MKLYLTRNPGIQNSRWSLLRGNRGGVKDKQLRQKKNWTIAILLRLATAAVESAMIFNFGEGQTQSD